jgi:hypothetical protein
LIRRSDGCKSALFATLDKVLSREVIGKVARKYGCLVVKV